MENIGVTDSQDGRKPDAPTIGSATAGNASASVTFTAPAFTGKGTGTLTYTATVWPTMELQRDKLCSLCPRMPQTPCIT